MIKNLVNLKSESFINFIKNFDKDFEENKSLDNSPWIYFREKHFNFLVYEDDNFIDGILVYSIQENTFHIHFIYIDQKSRGKGIGKYLFKEMEKNITKEIKFITNHIKNESDITFKIFNKLNYNIVNQNNIDDIYLKKWIEKAKKFNDNLFHYKTLVAKKVNF